MWNSCPRLSQNSTSWQREDRLTRPSHAVQWWNTEPQQKVHLRKHKQHFLVWGSPSQRPGSSHIISTQRTINWPEHWWAGVWLTLHISMATTSGEDKPVSGPLSSNLRESTVPSHVLSHTDTEHGAQGRWHLWYKTTAHSSCDKQTLDFWVKCIFHC